MPVLAPPRLPHLGSGRDAPPPIEEESGGGGDRGWVALVEARDDIEAHLLMGRLTASGIECSPLKQRARSASWVHGGSNPWAPVTIMVRRHQFDDARIVLAEVAMDAPAAEPGPRGGTGSSWKGPLLWWALALGMGLLLSTLSFVGTAAEAERCRRDPTCVSAER